MRELAALDGLDQRTDRFWRLPIFIRQGECLLEAADYIRQAGGVQKWLKMHASQYAIRGRSRTYAFNLTRLARAGTVQCMKAIGFVDSHPEVFASRRSDGLDFFCKALVAFQKGIPMPASPTRAACRPPKEKGRADRAETEWLRDLGYRLMAELGLAVEQSGWRADVLTAIQMEFSAGADGGITTSEPRNAHACHYSCNATDPRFARPPAGTPSATCAEPASGSVAPESAWTGSLSTGIHLGDALQLLGGVPSRAIDLIVTSPPYPGKPDGVAPDAFVSWWLQFAAELQRVCAARGSLVLNIREPVVEGERHSCVLSMIAAMRNCGWRYVEDYIWVKKASFPASHPGRLRNAWEHCLHFTRQREFAFYPDQVRVPIGKWASRHRPSASAVFRRSSATGSSFASTDADWDGRAFVTPPNVLHIAPESRNLGHPAVFPEAVPEFFIKLLSRPGDCVMDPFLGSGTTLVAAERLGRRFIGFERDPRYVEIAVRRSTAVAAPPGSRGKLSGGS